MESLKSMSTFNKIFNFLKNWFNKLINKSVNIISAIKYGVIIRDND